MDLFATFLSTCDRATRVLLSFFVVVVGGLSHRATHTLTPAGKGGFPSLHRYCSRSRLASDTLIRCEDSLENA